MKQLLLFPLLILIFTFSSPAQTLRYFEFTTICGQGNWQDTAFVAATSDQEVIDSVLADISRPFEARKFISGSIDYGDGGHNRNASHTFLWHFIPNQWTLVETAVEVCDGCPYTDLDSDTAYWVRTLGYFCPWSGKPTREISAPTSLDKGFELQVSVFPNPGKGELRVRSGYPAALEMKVFNALGQQLAAFDQVRDGQTIALKSYAPGLYLLQFSSTQGEKLIKWVNE